MVWMNSTILPVETVQVGGIKEVILLVVSADVLHDVGRDGLEGRRVDVRLVAYKTIMLRRAVTVRVITVLVHWTLSH